MKSYLITNPETLKALAPLVKDKDKSRVAAFAGVWSATRRKDPEKAARVSVRMELSRGAQMYKVVDTRVGFLGTLNLVKARAYAAREGNGLIDVTGEEVGL